MGAERAVDTIEIPDYVVGERLGAGGFGEVFRARHTVIGRDVAIKILHAKYSGDPAAIARFVAEARAVNQVSHPGIVEIYDFGTLADGRQYCVMELLAGQTLRDLLRQRERLPLAEALPILRGIAEAVDAAHTAGIAHRDLKPDNVFVLPDGAIKLIDFGLAKLSSDAPAVTETGAVFGTPLYMSPEQCRGKNVDTRTDLYAFGCLAYHVLTGAPPFAGEPLEIALAHLNERPAPPRRVVAELPARIDNAILALLAKAPADRPATLTTAVEAMAGERQLRRRRRIRRGVFVVVGLTTIVAASVLGATAAIGGRASGRTCASSWSKLAGTWDVFTRAVVKARFNAVITRPMVDGAWHALDSELERYTRQWSRQWEESCTEDRSKDELLYAQRQTCLANALFSVRASVSSLATTEIAGFALAFLGNWVLPNLEDCSTVPVLRAQVAEPPAEVRDRVMSLRLETHLARKQVRAAVNVGDNRDLAAGLARLERIGNELEGLYLPAATEPTRWRARYLVSIASSSDDAHRPAALAAAEAAVAVSLARAEASRDELAVVRAYTDALDFALETERPISECREIANKGEAALARSGNAMAARLELDREIATLDAREGRLEAAAERLRVLIAPWERWAPSPGGPRLDYVAMLGRMGRDGEAATQERAELDAAIAMFGTAHWITVDARVAWAVMQATAGDDDSALAELDRAVKDGMALGDNGRWAERALVAQLGLAAASHRDDIARASARILAAAGHKPEDLATELLELGDLEGLRVVLPSGESYERARARFFSGDQSHYRAEDPRRAERDARRGIALLDAGNAAAAVAPLERAFATLTLCCGHFHDFAPAAELALANALWTSGGDKARARMMATYSRDHAGRLPDRAAERTAAELWLAAHPS